MTPNPNLLRLLKMANKNANVHTINKARCYYESGHMSNKIRIELGEMIQEAFASGDWRPLKRKMRQWL